MEAVYFARLFLYKRAACFFYLVLYLPISKILSTFCLCFFNKVFSCIRNVYALHLLCRICCGYFYNVHLKFI